MVIRLTVRTRSFLISFELSALGYKIAKSATNLPASKIQFCLGFLRDAILPLASSSFAIFDQILHYEFPIRVRFEFRV